MVNFMNSMAEQWWSWQFAMLWQTAVLIGIVWLADLAIRKWAHPQLRYALWMLVLVKLLIPPTWTSPASITAHIPHLAHRAATVMERENDDTVARSASAGMDTSAAAQAARSETQPFPLHTEQLPAYRPRSQNAPKGQNIIAADEIPNRAATVMERADTSIAPLSCKTYAMLTWLAGIIVLSTWLLVRLSSLRREHSAGRHGQAVLGRGLPEHFYAQLEAVAAKLGLKRLPRVVLTDKVACPAVFGVFRPVLLMPAKKFKHMSHQDTEHILLHELAHIKRGDLLVHAVYMLVQIVYWFNPLLWMARKPLQNLRELCCDATVARLLRENTVHYRETLLETARQLLAEPVDPGLGLLGLFENNNWLVTRLQWLEKNTWKNRPLRIATIFLLVSVMVTCVLPMGVFNPGPPKLVIKGTVTDAQTGQPIAGAKVGDNKEYNQGKFCTVTDSNGHYEYKTWHEEHAVAAEANGYNTMIKGYSGSIFQNEKEQIFNFELLSETMDPAFTIVMDNRATIELVGVCSYPSEGKSWWKPGGSPFGVKIETKDYSGYPSDYPGYEFVFRKTGEMPFKIESVKGSNVNSGLTVLEPVNLTGRRVHIKGRHKKTDIKIASPSGDWKTVHTASPQPEGSTSAVVNGKTLVLTAIKEALNSTTVSCSDELGYKNATRIIAVDPAGREYTGKILADASVNNIRQRTIKFTIKGTISQISFQTCPYEYHTFKNVALRPNINQEILQDWVEDFFKHNYRDITSRKTLEWGEPAVHDDGSISIRYKYDATIWGKDTIIENKVWTFDKDGKFLHVRKVGAEDIYSLPGVQALVEDFFANNYRDITHRETIEWGQPIKDENGNVSISYKYEATIWDADTVTNNEIYTFDKNGKFVSVEKVGLKDLGAYENIDPNELGITVYTVNKTVASFPESVDFSLPENTYVMANRIIAEGNTPQWPKVSASGLAARMQKSEKKPQPVNPDKAKKYLNAKIVEVHMKGDYAGVIARFPGVLPSYDTRSFKREDGKWLNRGNSGSRTLSTARAIIDQGIDYRNWQQTDNAKNSELIYEIDPNGLSEKATEDLQNRVIENMQERLGSDVEFKALENGKIEIALKTPNSELTTDNYTATLPNGVTVELLGIADVPADGDQWWVADGSPTENVFWTGTKKGYGETTEARQVMFQINGLDSAPGLDQAPLIGIRVHRDSPPPDGAKTDYFHPTTIAGQTPCNLNGLSFTLHDGRPTADVSVTIGQGPWETLATKNAIWKPEYSIPTETKLGTVIIHKPTAKWNKTTISATLLSQSDEWQIVAEDKQGKIHAPKGMSWFSLPDQQTEKAAEHQICEAEFSMSLRKINKFHFRTRPTETVVFKNVALNPGGKTEENVQP